MRDAIICSDSSHRSQELVRQSSHQSAGRRASSLSSDAARMFAFGVFIGIVFFFRD
ncbi:hypothetical protein [Dongia rigui]|uniref:Uncharacterized protein n=1 Tax=Dongia rigui TaxID=940149 RepID=A0ABU5DXC8_9PROT|nr:hypothetical protein [Dongia rigui]MDY0871929.1 hypothetical protein [Dongia rigui]